MTLPSSGLPPSSSLPPVRSLYFATEEVIVSSLHNLQALYCPLRLQINLSHGKHAAPAQVDSGYVSEDEDEVAESGKRCDDEQTLAVLRADEFERSFTVRWLTSLIARADELPLECDDTRDRVVNDAAFILSSFSEVASSEAEAALTRDFSFPTPSSETIDIRLNDAPLSEIDHTDVGLQSWGASIIFSGLMCASPGRFGLERLPPNANIIELGAGTGLIGLTAAKMFVHLSAMNPQILATDYHPAVLDNLRANIVTNFPNTSAPISTMLLDWSTPPPALESTADVIFAADVVYAPEHATWLRDCVAQLLKPGGLFWLVVTVRKHGKFEYEGIPETAETAFRRLGGPEKNGHILQILEKTMLAKQNGIGRGDENGYMLFQIGWGETSRIERSHDKLIP
jgi:predicted nicotinamide N-methyase